MQPVLFTIFDANVTSHGFFFALGALISCFAIYYLQKNANLNYEDSFYEVMLIFGAGLIGARIGFFLIYPSTFSSVSQVFQYWDGGLLSYTGIIAGAAMAYGLFCGANFWRKFDIAIVAVVIGWAVGRVGNYLAADSGGIINSHFSWSYGRVPIQLFESGLLVFLGSIGVLMLIKNNNPAGRVGFFVSTSYFLGRFVIDFWRDEGYFWSLHYSQIASLLAAFVVIIFWRKYYK